MATFTEIVQTHLSDTPPDELPDAVRKQLRDDLFGTRGSALLTAVEEGLRQCGWVRAKHPAMSTWTLDDEHADMPVQQAAARQIELEAGAA